MHGKLMREALNEVRSFRDTTEGGPGSGPQKGGKKFSSSEIKKAYGILNDPRYKQGNYTGAAKAINKLAPGLADHPDVKNAMKRANENLDLPATGDTTTSNASQEVEQVEDLKEYTGMGNLPKSVNSNDVATALKNLKKGTKLQVSGKPQGGMRTMGTVLSVSGDTVKIKPTASNGPTSVKVKDITMMDTLKEEMKDLQPDAKEINAMVKDPHKSKEGNPKDDILAMWSKESVKADVKAKGGADMAKVQDKAEMMYAMKQINAMYKENKYLPTKEGSIQNVVAQMQVNEMKTVTVRVKEFGGLVETYLARGGVKGFINDELTEGKQVLPLKEVRTFIDTYNRHFLTNYRAEEFIIRDRLNEAIEKEGSMVGKYKVVYDPMANEFEFVNKQAMSDNSKKVGGDSGIKKMMKQGKTVDQISKEFGMFKDAVKMMAD